MTTLASPSVANTSINRDRVVRVLPGSLMLPVVLVILLGSVAAFIVSLAAGDIRATGEHAAGHPIWWLFISSILIFILGLFLAPGFFTLQPNESRVLILFGRYVGTVRTAGFHWGNPFYSNGPRAEAAARAALRRTAMAAGEGQQKVASAGMAAAAKTTRFRVSLRVRNMLSDKLKVNDKRGNPIEIAAVIVWRVHDAAQAVFDVDDYENYVRIQSESAIRHLASSFAYDHGEENEVTLRSGADEVADALRAELQARLGKAGVTVEEARITHLAYAPEIAQAMLRRQQAEAVIAARQKIVHGAVSMVDMALRELAEKHVVTLDDERKAAMVSNLMVVLCGESEVHPIVNTGTLYG
jgi:regulator of protease activity HflC (stomatin/prohibitin superfamily)